MRLRRPSFPTVIAFAALFVALGGPAQAQRFVEGKLRKGSVDSRVVENRSLKLRDLRKKTVRVLKRTPNQSVTEAKLRNGAVTPGKLAPGAVGTVAIADNSVLTADLAPASVGGREIIDGSVTGAELADGTLGAHDLARFYGRFTMRVGSTPEKPDGPIDPQSCWTASQPDLAPERAGVNISGDVPVVVPDNRWPVDTLALTIQNSTRHPTRFAITACNVSLKPVAALNVEFRYLIIDLP